MHFPKTVWNPDDTPNFTTDEMACRCGQCGGLADMDGNFMAVLQALRKILDRPLTVTSGYRCPRHPDEIGKRNPGSHAQGRAADIQADSALKFEIIKHAPFLGFVGIGPAKTFIHLDTGHAFAHRPAVFTYDE